jgi:hypothetical protein
MEASPEKRMMLIVNNAKFSCREAVELLRLVMAN